MLSALRHLFSPAPQLVDVQAVYADVWVSTSLWTSQLSLNFASVLPAGVAGSAIGYVLPSAGVTCNASSAVSFLIVVNE